MALNNNLLLFYLLLSISDKKSGTLALICELMDMNLYEMIRGTAITYSSKRALHRLYFLEILSDICFHITSFLLQVNS